MEQRESSVVCFITGGAQVTKLMQHHLSVQDLLHTFFFTC